MTSSRHHGFTCPQCGSHYFGTHVHHRVMGDKYPHLTRVGQCGARRHDASSQCKFEWNRDDSIQEHECIYMQTPAEWEQSYHAWLKEIDSEKPTTTRSSLD